MSDLFGNHIVGFPRRRLKAEKSLSEVCKFDSGLLLSVTH